MPGKRPVRRPIHVGFRLTKAEAKLVKQCRQGDEVFSETARRLLLDGADADDTRRNLIRHHSTPEPDA